MDSGLFALIKATLQQFLAKNTINNYIVLVVTLLNTAKSFCISNLNDFKFTYILSGSLTACQLC